MVGRRLQQLLQLVYVDLVTPEYLPDLLTLLLLVTSVSDSPPSWCLPLEPLVGALVVGGFKHLAIGAGLVFAVGIVASL